MRSLWSPRYVLFLKFGLWPGGHITASLFTGLVGAQIMQACSLRLEARSRELERRRQAVKEHLSAGIAAESNVSVGAADKIAVMLQEMQESLLLLDVPDHQVRSGPLQQTI